MTSRDLYFENVYILEGLILFAALYFSIKSRGQPWLVTRVDTLSLETDYYSVLAPNLNLLTSPLGYPLIFGNVTARVTITCVIDLTPHVRTNINFSASRKGTAKYDLSILIGIWWRVHFWRHFNYLTRFYLTKNGESAKHCQHNVRAIPFDVLRENYIITEISLWLWSLGGRHQN